MEPILQNVLVAATMGAIIAGFSWLLKKDAAYMARKYGTPPKPKEPVKKAPAAKEIRTGVLASKRRPPATAKQKVDDVGAPAAPVDRGPGKSSGAPTVPEWLEERATGAPTAARVVMEALELRFQREFPEVLIAPNWSKFRMLGTVGGCTSLAIFLHYEVPTEYRTPLELRMRKVLEMGFPGTNLLFEDCARYIRGSLLDIERSKRNGAAFVLAAMWVLTAVNDGEAFQSQERIVAELANYFQNEFHGYWSTQNSQ